MDQEALEQRLAQYHEHPRKGGKRDVIQRVWRNAAIVQNHVTQELVFSLDWNIPKKGR
jgi:hypothetical protein